MWNANGSHLAVFGWRPPELSGDKPRTGVVICSLASKSSSVAFPDEGTELAGFAPDGLTYVTVLREPELISGRHQLNFSTLQETQERPGFVSINLKSTGTVELELPEIKDYVFAADMKTFRTVALKKRSNGEATEREVLEVDARRGKSVKSLLTFNSQKYAMSADGQHFAALDPNASQVTVFDLDRGVKLFDCSFPKYPEEEETPGLERYMVFSPDGRRLAVSCGRGRLYIVSADTGKVMPRLEGAASYDAGLLAGAFSADGRLLAASGMTHKQFAMEPKRDLLAQRDLPAERSWEIDGPFSAVWDTQTGKILKTWNHYSEVAFCPTRPVLAIFERNGQFKTRLGFWDFAAEVEKK